jgi:hypothetical protein
VATIALSPAVEVEVELLDEDLGQVADEAGGDVPVLLVGAEQQLQLDPGAAVADVDQEQELARLRLGGEVDVAGQHAQRRAGERDGAHLGVGRAWVLVALRPEGGVVARPQRRGAGRVESQAGREVQLRGAHLRGGAVAEVLGHVHDHAQAGADVAVGVVRRDGEVGGQRRVLAVGGLHRARAAVEARRRVGVGLDDQLLGRAGRRVGHERAARARAPGEGQVHVGDRDRDARERVRDVRDGGVEPVVGAVADEDGRLQRDLPQHAAERADDDAQAGGLVAGGLDVVDRAR